MSVETERSSTESNTSGLDYEETALTLGLPGGSGGRAAGGGGGGEAERKRQRGQAETVDLTSRIGAMEGEDRSDESSECSGMAGSNKAPAPKARVVGWPPVRNYRKNALKSGSNKFVKVQVDGAPYLRKVDLEAYSGYEDLLSALQDMFSCFTIRNYPNERKLVDPVHGTEYTPTYEDKDSDWMLVGDVPWKMFVEACKRLRLMKSSEAINLAPRAAQG